MARKQSIQPGRFCRECEHYYACSAQCGGLLHNTDATHCANFANISAYQAEIERLRLVVDEQDLALQKAENDLNTSRQAKWISVEDALPKIGEVLICTVGNTVLVAWHHGSGMFETGSGLRFTLNGALRVSHWMPLPSTEGLHDD